MFIQLGDQEVITKTLQTKLEAMAGLGNKLAHEYAAVNPQEIYRVVKTDHRDLIEFAKQIASFLKREE